MRFGSWHQKRCRNKCVAFMLAPQLLVVDSMACGIIIIKSDLLIFHSTNMFLLTEIIQIAFMIPLWCGKTFCAVTAPVFVCLIPPLSGKTGGGSKKTPWCYWRNYGCRPMTAKNCKQTLVVEWAEFNIKPEGEWWKRTHKKTPCRKTGGWRVNRISHSVWQKMYTFMAW